MGDKIAVAKRRVLQIDFMGRNGKINTTQIFDYPLFLGGMAEMADLWYCLRDGYAPLSPFYILNL